MVKEKIIAFILILTTIFCAASCGEKIPNGYKAIADDGLMFDEEGDFVSIYNYCPCVIIDGTDAYVWYCSNEKSGAHGDHIAYRRGKIINGTLYWGEKQILFGPTENTYYSGNICDPDVIKGEFLYKGETYNWLMAVLGCTTVDNSSNMFGFKVAKSPDGPWIDVPEISPLYDFYYCYPDYVYDGVSNFIWGWGQCSLISADKKGKVMLFYTGRSASGQKYEYWDFSDLENVKMLYETSVTAKGLVQSDGVTDDNMCNAQFMYDGFNDQMYVVCDVHPFEQYEIPTNLPNLSRVYSIKNSTDGGEIGAFFKNNKNTWKTVFDINKELTGFPRNHNCCFYRDPYGWMPEEGKLDVCYTMSSLGSDWKVLYTYRIYHTQYLLP